MDASLDAARDVYFEAGDHEHLLHITAAQYRSLIEPAEKVHFGVPERHATARPRDTPG